jgi:hypothetical protein
MADLTNKNYWPVCAFNFEEPALVAVDYCGPTEIGGSGPHGNGLG